MSIYKYVFQKDLPNDIRSFEWELKDNVKGQCKARIKVPLQDEVVGEFNQNICPPSQTKVEVIKLKNIIKKRAGNTAISPQKIPAEELATALATDLAKLTRLDQSSPTKSDKQSWYSCYSFTLPSNSNKHNYQHKFKISCCIFLAPAPCLLCLLRMVLE